MSRGSKLRIVDPVLTNLTRGYSNAEFIGTSVFPFVPVNKEAGKVPTFGKEAFQVFNTERAMRAKTNRLPVEDRDKISYATEEHDAAYPVDYREIEEDEFNARKFASFRAQSAILISAEKQAADLAFTPANYDVGSKETLAGADQFTHADSKPITVIRDAMNTVRSNIAKLPNTMVMGYETFKSMQDHSTFLERIKYSQKGIVTIDLLKAIFDIKYIFVGKGVYTLDDGTMVDLWNDSLLVCYVPEQMSNVERSVFEPSFGYTLRKRNHPVVDTWEEEGGKIENIRSTDNFVVKLLGADSGYLISDTCVDT